MVYNGFLYYVKLVYFIILNEIYYFVFIFLGNFCIYMYLYIYLCLIVNI